MLTKSPTTTGGSPMPVFTSATTRRRPGNGESASSTPAGTPASRLSSVAVAEISIDRRLLEVYGICHPGVAEHRFPGFGQANWGEIIHALTRAGYDSDLNIEGWHDPVYRDHAPNEGAPLAGKQLENAGLLVAKRTLEDYVAQE